MWGYAIAFVVCMGLFIYFMYDGTLFKRKRSQIPIQEEVPNKKQDSKLTLFLREHVYKKITFEFRQLKDSKNGYYYEEDNFSLTVFEHPTYRTAQLFQVKPYQQIAVMRANKTSLEEIELEYKEVPEESKVLIRLFFEKVRDMNLRNVHNTQLDEEIQEAHMRIQTLIEKIEEQSDLLTLEMNHQVKQMKGFDLPELMQRYQTLPTYDLQTGKMRIKNTLEEMEKDLETNWNSLLDEKKRAYERIVSLTEQK